MNVTVCYEEVSFFLDVYSFWQKQQKNKNKINNLKATTNNTNVCWFMVSKIQNFRWPCHTPTRSTEVDCSINFFFRSCVKSLDQTETASNQMQALFRHADRFKCWLSEYNSCQVRFVHLCWLAWMEESGFFCSAHRLNKKMHACKAS